MHYECSDWITVFNLLSCLVATPDQSPTKLFWSKTWTQWSSQTRVLVLYTCICTCIGRMYTIIFILYSAFFYNNYMPTLSNSEWSSVLWTCSESSSILYLAGKQFFQGFHNAHGMCSHYLELYTGSGNSVTVTKVTLKNFKKLYKVFWHIQNGIKILMRN